MCCWNGFATHFVENGSIVMYVARDGFYKMGAGNFHDQLIPNQPQKKSSMKWHWVLRGSIYKMGSTNWGGPTPPTLKTKWISILFCARPRPSCRPNRRDAFATEVRAHRPAGLPLSMPSCWQGNGMQWLCYVEESGKLVQSRAISSVFSRSGLILTLVDIHFILRTTPPIF